MNSIGSVTPVRNEVSAIDTSMPPTAARRSGRAAWYIARQAAGQAEHHHREEAGHEGAGGRVAGEEALQVAGDAAVKSPTQEPGDVVEDVVQAGDDQQPVEHAVDEQADGPEPSDRAAQRVHALLDARASRAERPRPPTSPAKPATIGTKRRPPKKAR